MFILFISFLLSPDELEKFRQEMSRRQSEQNEGEDTKADNSGEKSLKGDGDKTVAKEADKVSCNGHDSCNGSVSKEEKNVNNSNTVTVDGIALA